LSQSSASFELLGKEVDCFIPGNCDWFDSLFVQTTDICPIVFLRARPFIRLRIMRTRSKFENLNRPFAEMIIKIIIIRQSGEATKLVEQLRKKFGGKKPINNGSERSDLRT
jgi:hypothetical protein